VDDTTRDVLSATTTIDLTTYGARSGHPRRVEIWAWMLDGRYLITGTPGPRDWYANVLADPRVVVHLPAADLPGTAAPIEDLATRRRLFTHPDTSWYLTQTSLEDLVENSPVIEIHFDV